MNSRIAWATEWTLASRKQASKQTNTKIKQQQQQKSTKTSHNYLWENLKVHKRRERNKWVLLDISASFHNIQLGANLVIQYSFLSGVCVCVLLQMESRCLAARESLYHWATTLPNVSLDKIFILSFVNMRKKKVKPTITMPKKLANSLINYLLLKSVWF